MKQKTGHIIVIDGSAYKQMYEYMLWDIAKKDNVIIVSDKKYRPLFKWLLLRDEVRRLLRDKLDLIVYENNRVLKAIKDMNDKYEEICVLFTNAALYYNNYFPYTINKYKEIFSCVHYVLFYLDIVGAYVSKGANILREANVFDEVYTTDNKDAIRCGAVFRRAFYSILDEYKSLEIQRDVYFCGALKGRQGIIKDLALKMKEKGVSAKIDLVSKNHKGILLEDGLDEIINVNTDYIQYSEVLKKEVTANCILDVVQEGQSGLTLRPYEAVVYNRKLLTNNESILEFEFYDERYMKFYSSVEDIDWEWVVRRERVEYGYDGSFSPSLLLQDIEKRIERKGRIK